MRIHIFATRLNENRGGAHQNCITYARALKRLGHDVTVHTIFAEGNEPPQDLAVVEDVVSGTSFRAIAQSLLPILQRYEHDADVLLLYGHTLMWAAGLYRMQHGATPVAVYLDSHADSMKEQFRFGMLHRMKHRIWELFFGRAIASHIDCMLFTSPYLQKRYESAGVRGKRGAIVPNAFEFDVQPEPIAHDDVAILCAGRLSYEKGADVLVDACAFLPTHQRWHVRIAGEGIEKGPLADRVAALQLSDHIELLGWVDATEMPAEYARADIFVAPSRVPEPFGRSIVEAMHAGLPVVVPSRGGAQWVAGDGGITFENGDARSLAGAIRSLIEDAARRHTLGKRGVQRAEVFAAQRVGVQLAAALEALRKHA